MSFGKCVIILADKYFTSQTCANCFGRFNRRTRSHKFNLCQDCRPREDAMLPTLIVIRVGKRINVYQQSRKMQRDMMDAAGLMSKVKIHRKNRQKNHLLLLLLPNSLFSSLVRGPLTDS